jgi:hypothetical protein
MNNKRQMLKQVQHDRRGNDRLCPIAVTPSADANALPKTDAKRHPKLTRMRHPELVSGSISGSAFSCLIGMQKLVKKL